MVLGKLSIFIPHVKYITHTYKQRTRFQLFHKQTPKLTQLYLNIIVLYLTYDQTMY